MVISRMHPDQDGQFYTSMSNTYQHPGPNMNVMQIPLGPRMYGYNGGNELMKTEMVPSYCVQNITPHHAPQPSPQTTTRAYNIRPDMHQYPMQPKLPSAGSYSTLDNSCAPHEAINGNMYPNSQYTMAICATQEVRHDMERKGHDGGRNVEISPVYNHHGYTTPMHSHRVPVSFQQQEYNAHHTPDKSNLIAPSHASYSSQYGYTQGFDDSSMVARSHPLAASQLLRSGYTEMYGNYTSDSKQSSSLNSHQKGQMAVNMVSSTHVDAIIERASESSPDGAIEPALVAQDFSNPAAPSEFLPSSQAPSTQSKNVSLNLYMSPASSSSSQAESHQQPKPQSLGGNPVAAFLKKQQMRKQHLDLGEPSPGSSSSQTGLYAPVHPSNADAVYIQRSVGPMPRSSEKHNMESSEASLLTTPSSTQDTAVIDEKEPAWKKVRPRTSFDATRSSISRRLRNSNSGSGLIGRGSLDVFLSEIGDLGRISDLKMEEFQGMEAVWRVSDDMSRLSL